MDFSKVTNQEARRFLTSFFLHREINREFYCQVPENRYDFRMVNVAEKISDSPRESLAHQINVQRAYTKAIKTGELKFGSYYDQKLKDFTKKALLLELERADEELIQMLSKEKFLKRKIVAPWSKKPANPVEMLWGLYEHEILHTGWNLALMDHLRIKRFPALRKVWG